jgi:hypothetical protein
MPPRHAELSVRQIGRMTGDQRDANHHAFQFVNPLFDHLVGDREERFRHLDAQRLGGLEVYD